MSKEHGNTTSYVTGFLLCLLCTAVAYYLVVTTSFSKDVLLAAIMGFAVTQMLIQLVFFLHLGQGPKPLYNIAFFVSTIGIILIVIVGSLFIMSHLHYNMTPSEASKQLAEKEALYQVEGNKTGACQGIKTNHKVTITGGKASPIYTEAHLCDTLTFINEDNALRDIAFGTHPNHATYAGESELTLRKGRAETITLNQPGTFQFHDHLHPEISGNFTVAP